MFDIGSKLACVDDLFPPGVRDIFNAIPVKGSIYTVRDIVPAQDWNMKATCAVLLHELVNRPNQHGIEPGFQCYRFRELTEDEVSAMEKQTASRPWS